MFVIDPLVDFITSPDLVAGHFVHTAAAEAEAGGEGAYSDTYSDSYEDA